MALVTVVNLNKRLGGKSVLWDINLEVEEEEILGIYGLSGSGKSTLARILAGIEEQTSGDIYWGDDEIAPFCPSLAFSSPAVAPELTVHENLNLFASLWGISRKKRGREISFLLELLKLTDFRSARVSTLSSGALNRLELARALVADSPLVIIDSLLDTLDSDIFEKLWEHILSLRRSESKSFVILTSSAKVAEVCGKIAVINRGRIGFIGKADDFRRLAGEDMVVLGDVSDPLVKKRIQDKFSLIIQEEQGFLSFRVSNGERAVGDLLAEYGSDLSCVYLKRPTLEDALEVLANGGSTVTASINEGKYT